MKTVKSKKIPWLTRVIPNVHYDHRGEYVETWNSLIYAGIRDITFLQDDISTSKHGVLRGLHGDYKTWKLIQCLKGEIFVAVVDFRMKPKGYKGRKPYDQEELFYDKSRIIECGSTWGNIETFILNDKNRNQLLIPPGCANGHQVISAEDCIFSYKQSTLYEGADKQFTLLWNDEVLNINWPIKDPILSSRDSNGLTMQNIYDNLIENK